jgi:pimeloyl-ACP methyl ester carboxylesterase
VKGLVLIGAFATLYRYPAIREFIMGVVQHLSDPIDRSIVEECQLGTVARPMPERFFDTVVGESLKVPARVWRAAFDALVATPGFSSLLARVSAPGLLLWGDADAFASRADQEALPDALPDAALLVYRGGVVPGSDGALGRAAGPGAALHDTPCVSTGRRRGHARTSVTAPVPAQAARRVCGARQARSEVEAN